MNASTLQSQHFPHGALLLLVLSALVGCSESAGECVETAHIDVVTEDGEGVETFSGELRYNDGSELTFVCPQPRPNPPAGYNCFGNTLVLFTDQPSLSISIEADGRRADFENSLVYDGGCGLLAELEAVLSM